MTDPAPSDAELELASAYADGEANPAEAAAVEADPRLRALAERLAAIGPRLAVGPPPPGSTDDHVARAMEAFDGHGDDSGGATVVDLADRRPWYRSVPLAAAAAALVVVALVGAFAVAGSDDDGEQVATRPAEESAEAFEATVDDAVEAVPERGAAAGPAPSIAAERPRFADLEAFLSHVEGLTGADAPTTPEADTAAGGAADSAGADGAAGGGSGCDPLAVSGADGAAVVTVIDAVVSGRDVSAVVVDDDGRRVVVVDVVVCEVVEDRRL